MCRSVNQEKQEKEVLLNLFTFITKFYYLVLACSCFFIVSTLFHYNF